MSRSRPTASENALAVSAYWLGSWFTGARREGLLALLPPEAWHTLSALLSFTTRDGRRLFTVDQLALTLGLNRERAEARLATLLACRWREAPLLTLETDPEGEVVGAELAPLELLAQVQPPPESTRERRSGRLASVSVEGAPAASVPEPAGMPTSDTTDELAAALVAVGLNSFQIEWLRRRFPEQQVRRQLEWLPARAAHNPPALLIRAIEQDWDPPQEDS